MCQLTEKIAQTKTMPELDECRMEVAEILGNTTKQRFDEVQGAFIKAKNRLKRIPLMERKGW